MDKIIKSQALRVALSGLTFVGLFFIVYTFVVTSIVSVPSLQKFIPNIGSDRAGQSMSLPRYNDFEEQNDKLDVIALGSSVVMRGVNPERLKNQHSIEAYNLASPAQTPNITYAIAKRYVDENSANTVIVDTYWRPYNVGRNGLESAIDIYSNTSFSSEWLSIASSVNNVNSYNSLVGNAVYNWLNPISSSEQEPYKGRVYTGRGFFYKTKVLKNTKSIDSQPDETWEPNEMQITHIDKLIGYLKALDVEIVMVRTPVTDEYLTKITNYDETLEPIQEIAKKYQVKFIDFNSKFHKKNLNLNTLEHFTDTHHLSLVGSNVFTDYITKVLRLK